MPQQSLDSAQALEKVFSLVKKWESVTIDESFCKTMSE